MAQHVKVPATKLDDLSLIHETHVVEGENCTLQIALWPPLGMHLPPPGLTVLVNKCDNSNNYDDKDNNKGKWYPDKNCHRCFRFTYPSTCLFPGVLSGLGGCGWQHWWRASLNIVFSFQDGSYCPICVQGHAIWNKGTWSSGQIFCRQLALTFNSYALEKNAGYND